MSYQILKDKDGWYIATADIYGWDLCRGRRHTTAEGAQAEMELWELEDQEAKEEFEDR